MTRTPIQTPVEAGQSFAKAAHALIAHFQAGRAEDSNARAWLRTTSALLAELYAAGLRLPEEPPVSSDGGGARRLFAPVRLQLDGPRAYFRHADPRQAGTEEVGDIEEDFEDLLREVTRGLASFDDGTALGPAQARAYWRRSLPHWGHHAVKALRALHYRLNGLPA